MQEPDPPSVSVRMNADRSTALPDAPPTPVRDACKPSLMGGMWECELAPEALPPLLLP
jgi:hypothetical protein